MEEWLDIVDASDTVIGRETRFRIHAEGHFHRSAHIVLFNNDGDVFVQLRSMSKDNDAGLWDTSVAGHVDSGESYLDCALRELQEELGVVVEADALQLVGKLEPEARYGFEFACIYTVCSEQQVTLQPDEIDDGVWRAPNELDNWIHERRSDFTEAFLAIWPLVRAGLDKSSHIRCQPE